MDISDIQKKYKHPSFVTFTILFVLFLYYGFYSGWQKINSDFPNYYVASKLVVNGEDLSNIYDDDWFQSEIYKFGINELGKFSPFPPVTSFVMIIPSFFNPVTAKRIYLIFNLFLLFLTSYYLFKISNISILNSSIIILLSGAAVLNNFKLGQFYLLLLFLIVLGLYLIKKKQYYKSGILWGIGAAVKYFPIIFLPAFFNKDKIKIIYSFILSIVVLNIVGLIVSGFDVYKEFFTKIFFYHLNGELSSQSVYSYQFQSWNSLLRKIFVYHLIENPHPLFNWNAGLTIFRYSIYLLSIFLTYLSFKKLNGYKYELEMKISLLTVFLLFISPASATYHFLLLSLPTIILLKNTFENEEYFFGIAFLIIHTLIGYTSILFIKLFPGYTNNLFLAYNRLWLISIYFFLLNYYIYFRFISKQYFKNNRFSYFNKP